MKTRIVNIRVSPDEKELLKKLSSELGMNISNYLIHSALLNKKLNKSEKEDLKDLLINTRKIGNNLNQIARSLNYLALIKENELIISPETMEDIKLSIKKIQSNQQNITYFISKIL